MRLFAAIPFSEEIRTSLAQAAGDLRRQAQGGNFTRPENFHLTLAFIGETDRAEAAIRVLERCRFSPFSLTISGTGRFGDLWWAGADGGEPLRTLARRTAQELRAEGFLIDKRPFKPHITLARQVRAEAPCLTVPSVAMDVRWISLMLSERIDGRLTYTELYGHAADQ